MSREFLNEVLDKFAKVTAILVETSKIKEMLEKSSSRSDLEMVFEQTETQVNKLLKHATSVKEVFDAKKDKAVKSLRNGDINKNTELNGENDIIDSSLCESSDNSNKPIIKLVDINKLVEPRSFKQDPVTSSPIRIDDTVVLITSSDEETTKKNTSVLGSKRRAARVAVIKTTKSLQVRTSSESSESEPEIIRPSRNRRQQKNRKDLEKIFMSDSDSDDSQKRINNKKEKNKSKKAKTTDLESDKDDYDWKSDPKFNSECYVKLLRVPCEKLKEFYLEKLDLLEINK